MRIRNSEFGIRNFIAIRTIPPAHPGGGFLLRYPEGVMPRINDHLTIDDEELRFEFARSSGPGGQNVNKVETKVRLLFDVRSSRSLSPHQKALIDERLNTRITKKGVLFITSQRHRSREANRKATIERFTDLLSEALTEDEPRRKTRVSRTQKKRRLDSKRRHANKKAMRGKPDEGE